jgi:hypothetical protein
MHTVQQEQVIAGLSPPQSLEISTNNVSFKEQIDGGTDPTSSLFSRRSFSEERKDVRHKEPKVAHPMNFFTY